MDRRDILLSRMYARWLLHKGLNPVPIDLTCVDPNQALDYMGESLLRKRLEARQNQTKVDIAPPMPTEFDKIMGER